MEIRTTQKKSVFLGIFICVILLIRLLTFRLPFSVEHITYLIALVFILFNLLRKRVYKIIFVANKIIIVYKYLFFTTTKELRRIDIAIGVEDYLTPRMGKQKRIIIRNSKKTICSVDFSEIIEDENFKKVLQEIGR